MFMRKYQKKERQVKAAGFGSFVETLQNNLFMLLLWNPFPSKTTICWLQRLYQMFHLHWQMKKKRGERRAGQKESAPSSLAAQSWLVPTITTTTCSTVMPAGQNILRASGTAGTGADEETVLLQTPAGLRSPPVRRTVKCCWLKCFLIAREQVTFQVGVKLAIVEGRDEALESSALYI